MAETSLTIGTTWVTLRVRLLRFDERATRAGHSGNPTVLAPDYANKLPHFVTGKVARGATLSLKIRLGPLGLGFAQAVLFPRLLGPGGYGAVAVALSVAAQVAQRPFERSRFVDRLKIIR